MAITTKGPVAGIDSRLPPITSSESPKVSGITCQNDRPRASSASKAAVHNLTQLACVENARHGIRGIPTLMLFKDGQMASMKVGAMPKGKIVEWLAEAGVKADAA